ncbi:MAG TPA: DUF222 domain-containing protein [Acidimicrobiales bacterium]|nr:DUF222 domain-containing protein [Acidimicrobiales bacterium]
MLERLAEVIDEVDIPASGEAIAEVCRLVDLLNAKLSDALGRFDVDAGWSPDGATSLTAWLRHHTAMSGAAASSTARTARRLRSLPLTGDAWRDGRLSGGQVQAVVANVDDATIGLLADHEAELVPVLEPLDVAQTATAMRRWKERADAVVDRGDPAPARRSLRLSRTLGDRYELTGSLDAESGATIEAALRLALTDDAEGEERTAPQRRADALGDICRFFLDHQQTRAGGRHRPHLNIVATLDDLDGDGPGQVIDGPLLPAASLQRLLCDSAVHRVLMKGRTSILDYGTATRTVPANLYNALVLRDRHCRHPGCDRPPGWCEAHHVIHVNRHGPTKLTNLVLKCCRHHHLAHLPRWSETMDPDGTLTITDPHGRTWTTHPPGVLDLRLPEPAAA